MRVLASGFYGQQNMGDDAFVYVASHLAGTSWRADDLAFLSASLPEMPGPGRAVWKSSGRMTRAISIWAAMRADHVVQFGGSTLTRLTALRRDHLALARRRITEVSALGVSIGPFRNSMDQEQVRSYLEACTRVTVRDKVSLLVANELGIEAELGIDPAVLLAEILPRPRSAIVGPSTILVALGNDILHPLRNAQRLETLTLALRPLLADGVHLRVLVASGHPGLGDAALGSTLVERLRPFGRVTGCPYRPSARLMFREFHTASAVVGTRLHSAVFAFSLEIPFILWNYHKKCEAFVGRVGADEFSLVGDSVAPQALENLLRRSLEANWPTPKLAVPDACGVARRTLVLE